MPPNGRAGGRAVGRLVPVDDAGADIGPEAVVELWAAADQRGGEAVAGGIRLGDRGVEIGDADHLQHRAEQLHVRPLLDSRDVDDRRGEERLVLDRPVEMPDRAAALHDQVEKALLQLIGGRIVDHRAHERRRIGVRLGDDDPVGELADRLDERLVPAVLDDQPPRGGAALAGAEEGRLNDHSGGGVDVGRVPDDDRVVAAHFEREDLLRRVGELAMEGDAGAGRAGEEQAVDPGMARQRPADFGPALDAAQHVLGHARFVECLTRNSPIAGVFSDGLNTTALPAINAGTMWPFGRCAGKL